MAINLAAERVLSSGANEKNRVFFIGVSCRAVRFPPAFHFAIGHSVLGIGCSSPLRVPCLSLRRWMFRVGYWVFFPAPGSLPFPSSLVIPCWVLGVRLPSLSTGSAQGRTAVRPYERPFVHPRPTPGERSHFCHDSRKIRRNPLDIFCLHVYFILA